jgi:hypothetical protein
MKLRDIVGRRSWDFYKAMYGRNFKSIHGSRRSRRGWNLPWEEKNLVGELETPILVELNPPKNSRIPWRSHEIATKGLESSPLGVLERREEMRGEGVSFTRVGVKTQKPDHPVSLK